MDDGLAPKAEEFGIRGRVCLNPCCSGRWSRTNNSLTENKMEKVLILVVVEDGLVLIMRNSLINALARS